MQVDAFRKLEETMHVHVLISFKNFSKNFSCQIRGAA